MRISCNGCRALRKGCSDNCVIKPCLDWITSPESQANATLFLARFYGRAGLINLINSGPFHLRPAIFRSLLYESCGRIVNPVYGSVGLASTGSWDLCQTAVEAVLEGKPITQVSLSELALDACDIRHVSKDKKVNEHINQPKGRSKKHSGKKRKIKAESPQRVFDFMNVAIHDSEVSLRPSFGSGCVESDDASVQTVEDCGLGKVNEGDGVSRVKLELSL